MSAFVVELFDSRELSTGVNPYAIFRYTVHEAADEQAARQAVEDVSPAYYDVYGRGLYIARERINVTRLGENLWHAEVFYGGVNPTNQMVLSFDTSGGTQHVTHSRRTVSRYGAPGTTAPDFKGAIGVTADSVEGVDIVVPVYQWSETHYMSDQKVTSSYRKTVAALTGKVNAAVFREYQAGEVLFQGARGQRRGYGDWEVTFSFAASPNVANITIGDITGISKRGWDYLWVRYIDTDDYNAKALVKRPLAVYIEQVYDPGDFTLLGIDGGQREI